MVARSMHGGHRIYFDESIQEWKYSNNNSLVKDNWMNRTCGHCNKSKTPEGHDGCLGTLPGVINACCGHGVTSEAYIMFDNATELRGREAVDFMNNLKIH